MEKNSGTSCETALWLLFMQGDQDAFGRLFSHSYNSLYNYGLSCGMDSQQSADAIQDVFMRLYMRPSLVREPATLRPMLYRSVKNYRLNLLRRTSRTLGIGDLPSFDIRYTPVDRENAEPDEEPLDEKIDILLAGLSPRQREIVYLRFILEMSHDEICRVMDLSPQASRNLLHKAITKLRSGGMKELFYLFLVAVMKS